MGEMQKVTRQEFYNAIRPLDVHPRVDLASLPNEMHVSTWELRGSRRVVGISKTSSWGRSQLNEYFIAPEL